MFFEESDHDGRDLDDDDLVGIGEPDDEVDTSHHEAHLATEGSTNQEIKYNDVTVTIIFDCDNKRTESFHDFMSLATRVSELKAVTKNFIRLAPASISNQGYGAADVLKCFFKDGD